MGYFRRQFSERQTEDEVDFENNLINVGDELYHIYERTSDNNTNKYRNLDKAAIRYGVSDRAVAAVCNSMMKDLNLLDEFVKLDRSKVRREKHRVISIDSTRNSPLQRSCSYRI